ncbi:MAG: hypothetical protein A2Z27_05375 [candidate division Zixibacteria bacterium RBG_16_50_21]|nr:MAG: hypothetical protein A2Z27_05375 [candidate division Zixibacteria bacterium RBG_16_50_21]
MKKFLLTATFFFIVLVLAIGFSSCNKPKLEKVTPVQEIAVKETVGYKGSTKEEHDVLKTILRHASVMQLEDLVKRDQARRGLYAKEYTYTGPDGQILTKNELLARQKSERLKVKSVEVSNLKVRTYGQTALVNYQAKVVGSQRGLPYYKLRTSVTSVLVKRDGRWQIVTDHLTATSSS